MGLTLTLLLGCEERTRPAAQLPTTKASEGSPDCGARWPSSKPISASWASSSRPPAASACKQGAKQARVKRGTRVQHIRVTPQCRLGMTTTQPMPVANLPFHMPTPAPVAARKVSALPHTNLFLVQLHDALHSRQQLVSQVAGKHDLLAGAAGAGAAHACVMHTA